MAGGVPVPMLGMVGTGNWSTDTGVNDRSERKMNWREGILKLLPNGDTPITAITSKGRSERTDDPQFHWYERDLARQTGPLEDSGVYLENRTTAHSTGANTAGTVLSLKMKANLAENIKVGHTLRGFVFDETTGEGDLTKTAYFYVLNRHVNGDNSFVDVRLVKQAVAADLTAIDWIDITGTSFPEGAPIGESVTYRPEKFHNLTQIFRTPLNITRTAMKTQLRTGDAYKDLKMNALLYHGIEMEMQTLWGEKFETVGETGEKQRFTQGLIPYMREHAPDNEDSYRRSSALTWKQGGEDWMDERLEQSFRYGRDTKFCVAGPGALLGLQRLVKTAGQFEYTPKTAAYGVNVNHWITPFGEIYVKRHPLFSHKPQYRYAMLMFEPENLRFRYIDDTMFKSNENNEKKAGYDGYDGRKEEWLTEGGFEMHHAETITFLDGVGKDGALEGGD